MADVLDIVHRIDFEIEDQRLNDLTSTLKSQVSEIGKLTQRNAEYARLLKKMSLDETEGRSKIIAAMGKNKEAIDRERKSLEDLVFTNKKFSDQLTKEQGVIGALETKLKMLQQRRKEALNPRDYDKSITEIRNKLKDLNNLDTSRTGGLFPGMGKMGGALSAVSRFLPAIGGAMSIGALGSQMVDVTKKFEGYIQVLNNAYGSSQKAQAAFGKIQQFAAKTPYSVDELTSSFIKLKNRGFDPTTEEMTKMGDLAASQKKSFDQYVEALLDAQTGEYERLKEFGIKAKTVGDNVTFTFKGVSKTVSKFSEVDIRNAINGFGELQGVAGGMAGMATTLDGKLSNLGDTTDMLMYKLSKRLGVDSFLGGLIDMANDVLSAFDKLIDNSDELAAAAGRDAKEASKLADEYEKLASNTKLTADEKDRMIVIQGILVEKLGAGVLMLDKESGAMILNMKAVRELIRAKHQLANTKVLEKVNDARVQDDIIRTSAVEYKNAIKTRDAMLRQNPNLGRMVKTYSDYQDLQKTSMNYDAPTGEYAAYINALKTIESASSRNRAAVKEFKKIHKKTQEEMNANVLDLMGQQDTDLKRQLGLEDEVEKGTTSTTSATPKKKKTPHAKKGDTPEEKALKDIDEAQKEALAEEQKRNDNYLKSQDELLQKKEISQQQFDRRKERNATLHEQALLNISLKFDRQRSQYLKGGAKFDNESSISSAAEKLRELNRNIQEKAEAEIKAATDTFNQLHAEYLDTIDQTDAVELQKMREQHEKKLKLIDEQIKTETDKLKEAEYNKNTELAGVISKGIDELSAKRKAQEEKNQNDEVELSVSQEVKKSQKLLELQIVAINTFSENERKAFEENYLAKEKENADIIEQLISKNKDIKQIEERRRIAELFATYKAAKDQLKIYIDRNKTASGLDKELNEERIKNQQKTVDDASKNIRNAVANQGKSSTDGHFRSFKKERQELKEQLAAGQIDQQEYNKRIKELRLEQIKGYIQLADTAAQAAQTIISSFEKQAEREIEIRQKRVDKAKEIADRGNAEALQEEERRLDRAVKQKEKFARQQVAINLVMQASQIALAIASAAGETGVGAPIAIAGVLAALAAGFAAIQGFKNTDSFKDGVIDYKGKGTKTSDSNLVRISRGESVINADATERNREILEEINNGRVFNLRDISGQNVKVFHTQGQAADIAELKSEMKELKEAFLQRQPSTVIFDRQGMVTTFEEVQNAKRRRDKL